MPVSGDLNQSLCRGIWHSVLWSPVLPSRCWSLSLVPPLCFQSFPQTKIQLPTGSHCAVRNLFLPPARLVYLGGGRVAPNAAAVINTIPFVCSRLRLVQPIMQLSALGSFLDPYSILRYPRYIHATPVAASWAFPALLPAPFAYT